MSHDDIPQSEPGPVDADTALESGSVPPATISVCSFESFDYNAEEDEYLASFDLESITPSIAVIEAISRVTRVDPLQIELLHSKVDPEALDSLFSHRNELNESIEVSFTLSGYRVDVSNFGLIRVQPESS